jgi:hypothetical protein
MMGSAEKILLLFWCVQLVLLSLGGSVLNLMHTNSRRAGTTAFIGLVAGGCGLLISGSLLWSMLQVVLIIGGLFCGAYSLKKKEISGKVIFVMKDIGCCLLLVQSGRILENAEPVFGSILQMSDIAYLRLAQICIHVFLLPSWLFRIFSDLPEFSEKKEMPGWLGEEQIINFIERSLIITAGITGSAIALVAAMILRILWNTLFRQDHLRLRIIHTFSGIFGMVVLSRILFTFPFLP